MKLMVSLGLLLLTAAACGPSTVVEKTAPEPSSTSSASTRAPTSTDLVFDCPVTIPSETLAVPEPYPVVPSSGMWYGTPDLWTVLSFDGTYVPRLGVFWSQSFPGGAKEEKPDLTVAWQRLDADAEAITVGFPETTNANTAPAARLATPLVRSSALRSRSVLVATSRALM